MVAHGAHHLVGLHVVHVQDVQVVEAAVEGLADLEAQVHHCVEDAHLLELHHPHQVVQLARPRTHPLQLLDQHRTRRHPQEVLEVALQGNHVMLLEGTYQQLLELLEQLLLVLEVRALLQQERGVLKALEKILKPFAGLRVFAFVVEDLRHDVLGVVEEAEVFKALGEHSVIRHYL